MVKVVSLVGVVLAIGVGLSGCYYVIPAQEAAPPPPQAYPVQAAPAAPSPPHSYVGPTDPQRNPPAVYAPAPPEPPPPPVLVPR